jgi:hypothetical protein
MDTSIIADLTVEFKDIRSRAGPKGAVHEGSGWDFAAYSVRGSLNARFHTSDVNG